MKYKLSEIPNLDPEEFNWFISASRTGEYFSQLIEGGFLDLGYFNNWIPIGKTIDSRILSSSNSPCDIAVMYEWKMNPEERVWFHLLII